MSAPVHIQLCDAPIQIYLSGHIPADLICTIDQMGEHVAAAFEAAVIPWLNQRGIACTTQKNWETPREICERLHISLPHLRRAVEHPLCPAPLNIMRGPTTRIRYILSNPMLDAFLTRHLPKS